ncbi:hypothetical protein BACT_0304 [Bifidobacterium actinocoloniiforme DSM 22766]|uniref:Uncharacterized protein n=1 Tax=Bifidobacterium actinocoloniiforme DSM 22766 TaxID=1437605 RepID=A0A086YVU8_9BIFI|nr:hypothetical protein [Bifidobacterium actinocoloniiforme]AKV54946.1 hypothetical protein AB656_00115 [Bifidobacterium actinocoloniiforme DSM 22766]KFI38398.1 hypothetical protein BACT_0304 [Bifidobacterium actinocoloniiforme DSM 22766]
MASIAEFVRVFKQTHPEYLCEFGPTVYSKANPDHLVRVRESNGHLVCTQAQIFGSKTYNLGEFVGEDDERELADHVVQVLHSMDTEFDYCLRKTWKFGARILDDESRAAACKAWTDLLGYADFYRIEDLIQYRNLVEPIVEVLTDQQEGLLFLCSLMIDLMHPGYLGELYGKQEQHERILDQYRLLIVDMIYGWEIPGSRAIKARKLLRPLVERLPSSSVSQELRGRYREELLLLDWWLGDIEEAMSKARPKVLLGAVEQSRNGKVDTSCSMALWVVTQSLPGWVWQAEDSRF